MTTQAQEIVTGIRLLTGQIQMPLVSLPVNTFVVEGTGGNVLVSPHPGLTPGNFQAMAPIQDIVAPNAIHHLGIRNALAAFPEARLWGPAGIEKKQPGLPWRIWGSKPWPHVEELVPLEISGMPQMNETTLLHVASKTLLVGDLCFNITDAKGLGARLIFGIFGTYRRFAVSRLYMKYVKDRNAFERSVADLLARDFDNLTPAHGYPVLGGAREKLRAALRERGF